MVALINSLLSFNVGVINPTDSIGARETCTINHATRTELMSDFLDFLCLIRKEDVTRELHGSSIIREARQLSDLIKCIEQCMNPFFTKKPSKILYNLST